MLKVGEKSKGTLWNTCLNLCASFSCISGTQVCAGEIPFGDL